MPGSKFFVWGGGRWREVSPSGRVSGWGRARFLTAAGGRLVRCRRGAVLRGLRALSAGKPTTVHDGPLLSQLRLQVAEKAPAGGSASTCGSCKCGRGPRRLTAAAASSSTPAPALALTSDHAVTPAVTLHLNTEDILSRLLKSALPAGARRGGTAEAAVQADSADGGDRPYRRPDKNHNYEEHFSPKRATPSPGPAEDSAAGGTPEADDDSDSEVELCKELEIGEEDVALLRRCAELGRTPFPVDLLRYDEDDDYKRRVFLRINPIVNVTRCGRLQRMLREGRSRTRERSRASLENFASELGLRSVKRRVPHASEAYRRRLRAARIRSLPAVDSNKENEEEQRARRRRTERAAGGAGGGERDATPARREILTDNDNNARNVSLRARRGEGEPSRKPTVVPASSTTRSEPAAKEKRATGREYSLPEDAAIVRWAAGRARLVNGNRLWRELQPLHHQRTGNFRSWQSLRNRYLRSLLPRLALHVPPADAARLRAAAATGELKLRKSQRNSIFNEVRLPSAWSRRLRSPPRRTPSPPPSAQSSSRPSPSRPARRARSRVAPSTASDTSDSGESSSPAESPERRRSRAPLATGEARRELRSGSVRSPRRALRSAAAATPTYSELTRRFGSRDTRASRSPRPARTSRAPRPSRSPRSSPRLLRPPRFRSKTRRLYNPHGPV